MRVLRAASLTAIIGLAAACSGGGSSGAAGTIPVSGQNSTGGGSSGAPIPRPIVPALPGLVGYDLFEDSARAALSLAEETEDLVWADETEDAILAEIADLIVAPNVLVAIECRTTWCGVVVDGPDTQDSDLDSAIGDRLRALYDERSISTYGIGHPEGDWVAAYIEIVRLA